MHLHLVHTGTGNAQRKQQTRQQALPCDAGISRHHTAAAAAALTRPSRARAAAAAVAMPAFPMDPMHCGVCGHTDRQTDIRFQLRFVQF